MPSLPSIQQANSQAANKTRIVAVMMGGTGGIGAATCRELVASFKKPKLYIVGRSESAASHLTRELEAINSSAEVHFIQSDLSLIRNVDEVCLSVAQKESAIDLLFLDRGYLESQRPQRYPIEGRASTLTKKDNINTPWHHFLARVCATM
ncbi:hypothetical protein CEP52_005623 [Fusarium oligoseptatum]|uniref:Polyketide synthase n=1 Tax=Fusarium oligoseptatum TaxID=2604345 RepID=A0A428TXF5_9HYPO|nr:hypothetical protein CEP52_005623 [Fusarium oligoseptatum]